MGLTLIEFG